MMGVDFNKDKTWVGSSIALHQGEEEPRRCRGPNLKRKLKPSLYRSSRAKSRDPITISLGNFAGSFRLRCASLRMTLGGLRVGFGEGAGALYRQHRLERNCAAKGQARQKHFVVTLNSDSASIAGFIIAEPIRSD